MMKILITGAAGFIGSNMVDRLIKKGNFISLLRFFKHLIHGTLHHCKDVQLIQASTLTVQENEKHHTHIDAEYIGKHPITVHSIPLGLSIIY